MTQKIFVLPSCNVTEITVIQPFKDGNEPEKVPELEST